MNKKELFILVLSLALMPGLSACNFSMTPDVTPPPGFQAPVYQETEEITTEPTPEDIETQPEEGTPEPTEDHVEGDEGEAEEAVEVVEEEIGEETSPQSVIYGTVVNGSGGDLLEDLEVELYGYEGFDLVVELTTDVDEDGSFTFEEIELSPDFIFFTTIDYMGATYGSDFHIVEPEEAHLDLSVTIYESTADPSTLVVDRLHVFFEFLEPDFVTVHNSLSVTNSGDKTVVSALATEPTLRYILPEGASGLVFDEGGIGQPYVPTVDGFGDPRPIKPGSGEYQIYYAYKLPYKRGLEWVQPLTLPVDLVVLFLAGEKLDLESDVFEPGGAQTFNDIIYQVYVGRNLSAGSEAIVEISGRNPAAGSLLSLDPKTIGIILGAVCLALAALGVWSWLRPTLDPGIEIGYDQDSPEAVMDEIITLDEDFEAGKIGEVNYQRERAVLKDRLRDLMKN